MGIFNFFHKKPKLDSPVIYKKKEADSQLSRLESLLKQGLPAQVQEQISQDIAHLKSGDYGENQVKYVLENSYMPMYILHDVYLKKENLSAQIDFLVITRKLILVLECKNYSSNLQIDRSGQFIITKKGGTKQSVSDPTEQNRRHVELICRICPELKKRCYSAVVFTDSRSILEMENAPESIQKQVVKADKLVQYIRNLHEISRLSDFSDADMKKHADFFLYQHTENPVDYTAKYQKYVQSASPAKTASSAPVRKPTPPPAKPAPSAPAKKPTPPPAKPAPSAPAKKPTPSPAKNESPKPKTQKFSCPHCKASVAKSSYGWYCSKKCGMKLDKIYGTTLTDEQVSALLNGKSAKCTTKSGSTILFPEIEENHYQGKTTFQWKTKLQKNN